MVIRVSELNDEYLFREKWRTEVSRETFHYLRNVFNTLQFSSLSSLVNRSRVSLNISTLLSMQRKILELIYTNHELNFKRKFTALILFQNQMLRVRSYFRYIRVI